jgi:hypothetical protein
MNDDRMTLLVHKSIHNGANRLIRSLNSPFFVGYHRDTDATDVIHGIKLLHRLAIFLFDEASANVSSNMGQTPPDPYVIMSCHRRAEDEANTHEDSQNDKRKGMEMKIIDV